jgi:hypothetical protein
VQVGIEYTHKVKYYVYIERPDEIQTPTHWNVITRSTTALSPVLSPSNMFPPPSSHCTFILPRKHLVCIKKYNFITFFASLKIACLQLCNLKLKLGSVCTGKCCNAPLITQSLFCVGGWKPCFVLRLIQYTQDLSQ